MDSIAMWVGYAAMATGAIAVLGGLFIGAAMVSNKASHMVLDAYGGWKVFLEFREWYHTERPKVGAGGTAPEGHNAKVRGPTAALSPEAPSRLTGSASLPETGEADV